VNAKELTKIVAKTTKTGNSIVPLEIHVNPKGKIKILIGVGARRRNVEKKQIIKEKDQQRQMDKEIKAMRR
jgi:SsrA-binding protein